MPQLAMVAVMLAAAVLVAPVFVRLKLGTPLGYLAAGILIGPYALGLIGDPESIRSVGEIGVVLLLFVMGLELHPSRLWTLRKSVIGLGGAQVAISGIAIAAVSLALGQNWQASLVIGFGLALSSTALVLQTLSERRQRASELGRTAGAIVLFQNLALVILITLVSVMPGAPEVRPGAAMWLDSAKPLAAVIGLVLGGRLLVRPMLRLAFRASPELFAAATLLVVVVASLLMGGAGLPLSLGAFLAGALLADSPYRHEVQASIDPFKGLLLGLFFMALGMAADLGVVLAQPLTLIASVFALMTIKAAALYAIARANDLAPEIARALAAVLCQGGELGLVAIALAVSYAIVSPDTGALLTVIILISMATTPFLTARAALFRRDERNLRLRVFISYSRRDAIQADELVSFLESEGFDVAIDTRDLPFGQRWQAELEDRIRECEVTIWLVSDASIRSDWCQWEIRTVERYGKRLFPIALERVPPDLLPAQIGSIQLFPRIGVLNMTDADQRSALTHALRADGAWLKQYTRLAERARTWSSADRSNDWLIRGEELTEAQRWLAATPDTAKSPAPLVLDFIDSSRIAQEHGR